MPTLRKRSGRRYRFGATHERDGFAGQPTARGRAALLAGLTELLGRRPAIEITDQLAGVRPGTVDHYPFLGAHPNEPRLILFNGFGARGSLTIPWYSAGLVDHLEQGTALPPEANIARQAR